MKRLLAVVLVAVWLTPQWAWGLCKREPMVKRSGGTTLWRMHRALLPLPAPAYAQVTELNLKWFGHSFFLMTTPAGTRIMMDPFGSGTFGRAFPYVAPMPADAVTVGREHPNHNTISKATGNPVILRGLAYGGEDWNPIHTRLKEVTISNMPIYQRGFPGTLKGSSFIFEVDDLCIIHLGDLGEVLNERQLAMIGQVDVALVPIGGTFTMDAETAKEVVKQLKPRIAIPMHYWDLREPLDHFLAGQPLVRYLNTDTLTVNRRTLPPQTTIIVLTRQ